MTTARAKGTAFESAIRDYLRDQDWDVERLRQSGSLDEGDLVVRLGNRGRQELRLIIEAKNTVSMNLGGWLTEAEVEAAQYAKVRPGTRAFPVVVHKRRQKGVHGSYVTMSLSTLMALLDLAD